MKATIVLGTSTGGVGTHVRSLVERLLALGVDVAVAAPQKTQEQFDFIGAGAEFRAVQIGSAPRPHQDVAAVRDLRRAIAGADVVHAHGFRAAALAGLALGRRRPERTPLVATWHNAVLGGGMRRRLLAGLERLAALRADVTLGASSDLVARARELGAPDARLAPVAAPAMAAPSRDRDAVRTELGAEPGQVLVVAVGRLAPQKDYGTLLTAAAALRDAGVLIVIAGDGPLHEELQARIDAERLRVRLLGRRDDVPDLLAAADVYVLTSAWEARALVVQEAMAAGVPVVATAVGGVPELVDDAAVLVRAGAPNEVAEQLSALARDEGMRRDLAARGLQVAAGWPDEDETARQLAAVYREVVAGLTGLP